MRGNIPFPTVFTIETVSCVRTLATRVDTCTHIHVEGVQVSTMHARE